MHVPGRNLPNSYHILADKAFPICPEIMTPYKPTQERPLTQEEIEFNLHMNSVRQVRHAIGNLQVQTKFGSFTFMSCALSIHRRLKEHSQRRNDDSDAIGI